MLSFEFTPTKDDYLKSFKTFYLSNWSRWAILFMFLVLLLVYTGYSSLRGTFGTDLGGILPFLVAVAFFLYFMYSLFVKPRLLAGKVDKDESLSSCIQYQLTEEKITFHTRDTDEDLEWKGFQKLVESRDMFLLVYAANKNAFQIIPKRAFASPENEKSFLDLCIKQKLIHQKVNA